MPFCGHIIMAILTASLDHDVVNLIDSGKRAIMVAAKYSKLMDCPEANSRAIQKQRLFEYIHGIIPLPYNRQIILEPAARAANL